MHPDEIRFESIVEHREWYYVEYSPPINNHRFSTLALTIIGTQKPELVAEAMEVEVKNWLTRFPIPLMATAFTEDDSVYGLTEVRPIDHLMGWQEEISRGMILRWELVTNSSLPGIALEKERLLKIFGDIPYRTGAEIRAQAAKEIQIQRLGMRLILVWAVFVPLCVAVLEWWSDLLGVAVLAYAFGKAIYQWLKFTGRLPKSAAQIKREADELEARHHHYHCKRNPEAFVRLRAENFRNEAIDDTHKKFRDLKAMPKMEQLMANYAFERTGHTTVLAHKTWPINRPHFVLCVAPLPAFQLNPYGLPCCQQ